MPRKNMGRPRKQKRKNNLDEDGNISNSESTTNKNNMSESWECPVSARRDVIPNSRVISDRRRSLRSSKRLLETVNTSLPVCSHPKARQVPEDSDEGESPSKYLVQFVYPLTVEPHLGEVGVTEMPMPNHSNQMAGQNTLVIVEPALGHNETENVEKSTVGIPEKLGELGEAEMSLSSHSNQLAGQNTLVTVEPHLGHNETEIVGNSTIGIPEKVGQLGEAEMSLADHTNQRAGQKTFETQEIQASNKFEKIINKNHGKSISRVGCWSPSFSLKLTEVVGMVQNEDGDDFDSEIQSRHEDTVNGYQVKPEFMPILRKIINKHGDIAKNCIAKSVNYRSKLLELICEIISDFEKKNLSKIKESALKSKIGLVDEIKNMKVEVEWLRMRLAEVDDARDILKQFAILKEKTDDNRKLIEDAKSELVECEEQKKEVLENLEAIRDKETSCKQRLARATDDSTKIYRTVRFAKSKVGRFLYSSVMDGLI